MAAHVGIDLGTTLSGLAYLKADGTPEIVPNCDGERLTPSVVYFEQKESVKLVGTPARNGGDPERTVFQIKRHMDDPDYSVEFDGHRWTPSEISALILSKLKQDCSRIIGAIKDVIITVPANYNELARKSTIAAAEMAGMNVTRLVNEPTAAALYYAYRHHSRGRVLVFDLGGGTLDVTILDIDFNNIRIITSEGARHLGGGHIDDLLLELYSEQYRQHLNTELYTNERQRRRILQSIEDSKKMLSKLRNIQDTISNSTHGNVAIDLSRETFETIISRLLTRAVMLVEQTLDSAKLKPGDIDHVVLVGGSTRIPKVKAVLHKFFGKAPEFCGNVDEAVALGAALFARHAANIQEVCNHSYGTLAYIVNARTGEEGIQNSIVIPKNTPLPCSFAEIYTTSEANEQEIHVDITQGEDSDPRYIDVIGRLTLDVPPGRPAGCEIKVTFSYDENQRVRAMVLDRQTGLSKEIAVNYKGKGILTDEELENRGTMLRQLRIE
ncbi:Hsp70 family protein [Phragmitibacter flavus]|nr:Hsp70 family protein [Phragmitibacter flavus]